MEPKDWLSFFVGMIVTALGLLPLLGKLGVGPGWFRMEFLPIALLAYLVAAFGFYLLINSIIEITNSNTIGWTSFFIAVALFAAGVLQVLAKFRVGPDWFSLKFINETAYFIIFIIEGIFLMIACFAMEM